MKEVVLAQRQRIHEGKCGRRSIDLRDGKCFVVERMDCKARFWVSDVGVFTLLLVHAIFKRRHEHFVALERFRRGDDNDEFGSATAVFWKTMNW